MDTSSIEVRLLVPPITSRDFRDVNEDKLVLFWMIGNNGNKNIGTNEVSVFYVLVSVSCKKTLVPMMIWIFHRRKPIDYLSNSYSMNFNELFNTVSTINP